MEQLEGRRLLSVNAPSGLIASPDSSPGGGGGMLLTWADNALNETAVRVERREAVGGSFAQIASLDADATEYLDATAAAGTPYVYRVFATAGIEDSAASNEFTAAGWTSANVGAVTGGSWNTSGGVTSVTTKGNGIGGNTDDFRFSYRSLTGDGQIVARVASVQYTNPAAKAGVMFRDGTAANAKNVLMAITPGAGAHFQTRRSTGGGTDPWTYSGLAPAYWVKLVRDGSLFSGYTSPDGQTWTLRHQVNVSMGATLNVGLALASSGYGNDNTSTFDSVTVTRTDHSLPSGWGSGDVGSAPFAGSSRYYGGSTFEFAVEASGDNVGGTADTFHFAHKTVFGDGEIIAKVASMAGQDGGYVYAGAKGGIMFRDGTGEGGAGARNVFLAITGGGSAVWQSRSTAGGNTDSTTSAGKAAPYWVKVVRSGDTFTGYTSPDGIAWTQIGSPVTISGMSDRLEAGLALSAAGYGNLNTTRFERVSVTPSGDGLAATYFDNKDFTGTTVNRTDGQVKFHWAANQAPDPALASDTYAAEWKGQVLAPETGAYTFATYADDGVRLWVNGVLLIDNWNVQSPTTASGQIDLTAGVRYDLRLEYFQNYGTADVQLSWVVPGTAGSATVPADNLYSAGNTSAAPAAPTLTAQAQTDPTRVALTWTASAGAEFYVVYRSAGGAAAEELATRAAGVTGYTDSTAQPGAAYAYRVVAVSAGGRAASAAASVTIAGDVRPPPVTDLTAVAIAADQVALAWATPALPAGAPPLTGYAVLVSADGGQTFAPWATAPLPPPGAATPSYTVTGLDPGTAYVFKVLAQDAAGAESDPAASPADGATTTQEYWADVGEPVTVAPTVTGDDPVWLNGQAPLAPGEGYRLLYKGGAVEYQYRTEPEKWLAAAYAVRNANWGFMNWQTEPGAGWPWRDSLAGAERAAAGWTHGFSAGDTPMAVFMFGAPLENVGGPGVTWQLQKRVPVVTVSDAGYTTEGSETPATFTLNRDPEFNEPLTVTYTLSGGDIEGQEEHTATFPAGVYAMDVEYAEPDDDAPEWTEEVTVQVKEGDGYVVGSQSEETIEVVDDDPVDVVIQGLPEETEDEPNELSPGGTVEVNGDDDDGDNTPDNEQSTVDLSDDELVPVQLALPEDAKEGAELTLTLDPAYAGAWRVWDSEGNAILGEVGGALSTADPVLSYTLPVTGGPSVLVYVEALVDGASGGMTLCAADAPRMRYGTGSSDTIWFAVGAPPAGPDLDVRTVDHNQSGAILDEAKEHETGAFVPLNDDDDDYNGRADYTQTGAAAGDNDFLPIVIPVVADPTIEKLKLTGTGGILIYRKVKEGDHDVFKLVKGGSVGSAELDAPEKEPLELYVEGQGAGPQDITVWIKRATDTVFHVTDTHLKVTVFKWEGTKNVPQFGTYEYAVRDPPLATSQWVDGSHGSITLARSRSDVDITWGTGPEVGTASYQVNGDYIWDLDVNIVQVVVSNPAVGPAFTYGVLNNIQTQPGDAFKTIATPADQLALVWKAKVTFNGPKGDRGVDRMKASFVQNLTVTRLRGQYVGGVNATASVERATPYWDTKNYASYATNRFYSLDPKAFVEGRKSGEITENDRPEGSVPLHFGAAALVGVQMVWDFDLYVVALTKEIGVSAQTTQRNGTVPSDQVLAAQSVAHWQLDGSGSIGAAPAYAWTGAASAGVTVGIQGWGPAPSTPPVLIGPRFNDLKNQWR